MIRYARNGRAHIAYDVREQLAGEPRDLLMVSEGFVPFETMDDLPSLARVLRRLTTFSRVILFDRRGIGLSDPFHATESPSLEDWVQDAVTVLDAVGSAQVSVLGSVETSTIATLLAATRPDRVRSLVLINSAARATPTDGYEHGHPPEVVDALIDFTTSIEGGDGEPAGLVAPSAVGDPVFHRWWERAGRLGASPATARALLRMAVLADLRPVLPTIGCPVLVLRRREDPLVSSGMARYVADHVREGRFVEVPGADNLWFVGDTDPLLDEIERFLTGRLSAVDADRTFATIVFTDIVGSTALVNHLGEQRWRSRLDAHDDMVRRQLDRAGGREIKSTGDGFLATFTGPAQALECAQAMRAGAAQLGLRLRIGMHAGEFDLRGGDISGANVHVAARVAALAGPDEILVTGTIQGVLSGHAVAFEPHGTHELRGFPEPWPLYRALPPVATR